MCTHICAHSKLKMSKIAGPTSSHASLHHFHKSSLPHVRCCPAAPANSTLASWGSWGSLRGAGAAASGAAFLQRCRGQGSKSSFQGKCGWGLHTTVGRALVAGNRMVRREEGEAVDYMWDRARASGQVALCRVTWAACPERDQAHTCQSCSTAVVFRNQAF